MKGSVCVCVLCICGGVGVVYVRVLLCVVASSWPVLPLYMIPAGLLGPPKTTATPPILRNPPYVWVWRCFDRSRSHVRLRAFLGVQCGRRRLRPSDGEHLIDGESREHVRARKTASVLGREPVDQRCTATWAPATHTNGRNDC